MSNVNAQHFSFYFLGFPTDSVFLTEYERKGFSRLGVDNPETLSPTRDFHTVRSGLRIGVCVRVEDS